MAVGKPISFSPEGCVSPQPERDGVGAPSTLAQLARRSQCCCLNLSLPALIRIYRSSLC